jgi:hypothetical protein
MPLSSPGRGGWQGLRPVGVDRRRFDWRAVSVGHAAERKPPTDERYRFPLREDVIVTLRLPSDLTAAEATSRPGSARKAIRGCTAWALLLVNRTAGTE